MRIAATIIWLIAAYKLGDWPNWKKYYSTWLFWTAGSLIYETVFHDWHLWLYADPVLKSNTVIILFIVFTEYILVILLYLPHFPQKVIARILYLCLWVGISAFLEAILLINGYYAYFHGWNFIWSVVFDLFMFTFLIIHHKNHQILAWGLSLTLLIIIALIFHLPFPR